MMGYTHIAIGAAGALSAAIMLGCDTPEMYVIATVSGALGGVAVDFDTKDSSEMTDAGRSRIAVIGLVLLGTILNLYLYWRINSSLFSIGFPCLAGIVALVVLLIVGLFTEHRTFTHSLLFLLLTSASIYFILPSAVVYYAVGGLLHLIFDMLNNKYCDHGVWLLYPLKLGKGIALGLCKSGGTGNKVFYFIGLVAYLLVSVLYVWRMFSLENLTAPIIIAVYLIVALHFVRSKTERQLRHIDHIREGRSRKKRERDSFGITIKYK